MSATKVDKKSKKKAKFIKPRYDRSKEGNINQDRGLTQQQLDEILSTNNQNGDYAGMQTFEKIEKDKKRRHAEVLSEELQSIHDRIKQAYEHSDLEPTIHPNAAEMEKLLVMTHTNPQEYVQRAKEKKRQQKLIEHVQDFHNTVKEKNNILVEVYNWLCESEATIRNMADLEAFQEQEEYINALHGVMQEVLTTAFEIAAKVSEVGTAILAMGPNSDLEESLGHHYWLTTKESEINDVVIKETDLITKPKLMKKAMVSVIRTMEGGGLLTKNKRSKAGMKAGLVQLNLIENALYKILEAKMAIDVQTDERGEVINGLGTKLEYEIAKGKTLERTIDDLKKDKMAAKAKIEALEIMSKQSNDQIFNEYEKKMKQLESKMSDEFEAYKYWLTMDENKFNEAIVPEKDMLMSQKKLQEGFGNITKTLQGAMALARTTPSKIGLQAANLQQEQIEKAVNALTEGRQSKSTVDRLERKVNDLEQQLFNEKKSAGLIKEQLDHYQESAASDATYAATPSGKNKVLEEKRSFQKELKQLQDQTAREKVRYESEIEDLKKLMKDNKFGRDVKGTDSMCVVLNRHKSEIARVLEHEGHLKEAQDVRSLAVIKLEEKQTLTEALNGNISPVLHSVQEQVTKALKQAKELTNTENKEIFQLKKDIQTMEDETKNLKRNFKDLMEKHRALLKHKEEKDQGYKAHSKQEREKSEKMQKQYHDLTDQHNLLRKLYHELQNLIKGDPELIVKKFDEFRKRTGSIGAFDPTSKKSGMLTSNRQSLSKSSSREMVGQPSSLKSSGSREFKPPGSRELTNKELSSTHSASSIEDHTGHKPRIKKKRKSHQGRKGSKSTGSNVGLDDTVNDETGENEELLTKVSSIIKTSNPKEKAALADEEIVARQPEQVDGTFDENLWKNRLQSTGEPPPLAQDGSEEGSVSGSVTIKDKDGKGPTFVLDFEKGDLTMHVDIYIHPSGEVVNEHGEVMGEVKVTDSGTVNFQPQDSVIEETGEEGAKSLKDKITAIAGEVLAPKRKPSRRSLKKEIPIDQRKKVRSKAPILASSQDALVSREKPAPVKKEKVVKRKSSRWIYSSDSEEKISKETSQPLASESVHEDITDHIENADTLEFDETQPEVEEEQDIKEPQETAIPTEPESKPRYEGTVKREEKKPRLVQRDSIEPVKPTKPKREKLTKRGSASIHSEKDEPIRTQRKESAKETRGARRKSKKGSLKKTSITESDQVPASEEHTEDRKTSKKTEIPVEKRKRVPGRDSIDSTESAGQQKEYTKEETKASDKVPEMIDTLGEQASDKETKGDISQDAMRTEDEMSDTESDWEMTTRKPIPALFGLPSDLDLDESLSSEMKTTSGMESEEQVPSVSQSSVEEQQGKVVSDDGFSTGAEALAAGQQPQEVGSDGKVKKAPKKKSAKRRQQEKGSDGKEPIAQGQISTSQQKVRGEEDTEPSEGLKSTEAITTAPQQSGDEISEDDHTTRRKSSAKVTKKVSYAVSTKTEDDQSGVVTKVSPSQRGSLDGTIKAVLDRKLAKKVPSLGKFAKGWYEPGSEGGEEREPGEGKRRNIVGHHKSNRKDRRGAEGKESTTSIQSELEKVVKRRNRKKSTSRPEALLVNVDSEMFSPSDALLNNIQGGRIQFMETLEKKRKESMNTSDLKSRELKALRYSLGGALIDFEKFDDSDMDVSSKSFELPPGTRVDKSGQIILPGDSTSGEGEEVEGQVVPPGTRVTEEGEIIYPVDVSSLQDMTQEQVLPPGTMMSKQGKILLPSEDGKVDAEIEGHVLPYGTKITKQGQVILPSHDVQKVAEEEGEVLPPGTRITQQGQVILPSGTGQGMDAVEGQVLPPGTRMTKKGKVILPSQVTEVDGHVLPPGSMMTNRGKVVFPGEDVVEGEGQVLPPGTRLTKKGQIILPSQTSKDEVEGEGEVLPPGTRINAQGQVFLPSQIEEDITEGDSQILPPGTKMTRQGKVILPSQTGEDMANFQGQFLPHGTRISKTGKIILPSETEDIAEGEGQILPPGSKMNRTGQIILPSQTVEDIDEGEGHVLPPGTRINAQGQVFLPSQTEEDIPEGDSQILPPGTKMTRHGKVILPSQTGEDMANFQGQILPHGTRISKTGKVILPSKTEDIAEGEGQVLPPGSRMNRKGQIILPSQTVEDIDEGEGQVLPPGTRITEQGQVVLPSQSIEEGVGQVFPPGTRITDQGEIILPSQTVEEGAELQGQVLPPGTRITEQGEIIFPSQISLDGVTEQGIVLPPGLRMTKNGQIYRKVPRKERASKKSKKELPPGTRITETGQIIYPDENQQLSEDGAEIALEGQELPLGTMITEDGQVILPQSRTEGELLPMGTMISDDGQVIYPEEVSASTIGEYLPPGTRITDQGEIILPSSVSGNLGYARDSIHDSDILPEDGMAELSRDMRDFEFVSPTASTEIQKDSKRFIPKPVKKRPVSASTASSDGGPGEETGLEEEGTADETLPPLERKRSSLTDIKKEMVKRLSKALEGETLERHINMSLDTVPKISLGQLQIGEKELQDFAKLVSSLDKLETTSDVDGGKQPDQDESGTQKKMKLERKGKEAPESDYDGDTEALASYSFVSMDGREIPKHGEEGEMKVMYGKTKQRRSVVSEDGHLSVDGPLQLEKSPDTRGPGDSRRVSVTESYQSPDGHLAADPRTSLSEYEKEPDNRAPGRGGRGVSVTESTISADGRLTTEPGTGDYEKAPDMRDPGRTGKVSVGRPSLVTPDGHLAAERLERQLRRERKPDTRSSVDASMGLKPTSNELLFDGDQSASYVRASIPEAGIELQFPMEGSGIEKEGSDQAIKTTLKLKLDSSGVFEFVVPPAEEGVIDGAQIITDEVEEAEEMIYDDEEEEMQGAEEMSYDAEYYAEGREVFIDGEGDEGQYYIMEDDEGEDYLTDEGFEEELYASPKEESGDDLIPTVISIKSGKRKQQKKKAKGKSEPWETTTDGAFIMPVSGRKLPKRPLMKPLTKSQMALIKLDARPEDKRKQPSETKLPRRRAFLPGAQEKTHLPPLSQRDVDLNLNVLSKCLHGLDALLPQQTSTLPNELDRRVRSSLFRSQDIEMRRLMNLPPPTRPALGGLLMLTGKAKTIRSGLAISPSGIDASNKKEDLSISASSMNMKLKPRSFKTTPSKSDGVLKSFVFPRLDDNIHEHAEHLACDMEHNKWPLTLQQRKQLFDKGVVPPMMQGPAAEWYDTPFFRREKEHEQFLLDVNIPIPPEPSPNASETDYRFTPFPIRSQFMDGKTKEKEQLDLTIPGIKLNVPNTEGQQPRSTPTQKLSGDDVYSYRFRKTPYPEAGEEFPEIVSKSYSDTTPMAGGSPRKEKRYDPFIDFRKADNGYTHYLPAKERATNTKDRAKEKKTVRRKQQIKTQDERLAKHRKMPITEGDQPDYAKGVEAEKELIINTLGAAVTPPVPPYYELESCLQKTDSQLDNMVAEGYRNVAYMDGFVKQQQLKLNIHRIKESSNTVGGENLFTSPPQVTSQVTPISREVEASPSNMLHPSKSESPIREKMFPETGSKSVLLDRPLGPGESSHSLPGVLPSKDDDIEHGANEPYHYAGSEKFVPPSAPHPTPLRTHVSRRPIPMMDVSALQSGRRKSPEIKDPSQGTYAKCLTIIKNREPSPVKQSAPDSIYHPFIYNTVPEREEDIQKRFIKFHGDVLDFQDIIFSKPKDDYIYNRTCGPLPPAPDKRYKWDGYIPETKTIEKKITQLHATEHDIQDKIVDIPCSRVLEHTSVPGAAYQSNLIIREQIPDTEDFIDRKPLAPKDTGQTSTNEQIPAVTPDLFKPYHDPTDKRFEISPADLQTKYRHGLDQHTIIQYPIPSKEDYTPQDVWQDYIGQVLLYAKKQMEREKKRKIAYFRLTGRKKMLVRRKLLKERASLFLKRVEEVMKTITPADTVERYKPKETRVMKADVRQQLRVIGHEQKVPIEDASQSYYIIKPKGGEMSRSVIGLIPGKTPILPKTPSPVIGMANKKKTWRFFIREMNSIIGLTNYVPEVVLPRPNLNTFPPPFHVLSSHRKAKRCAPRTDIPVHNLWLCGKRIDERSSRYSAAALTLAEERFGLQGPARLMHFHLRPRHRAHGFFKPLRKLGASYCLPEHTYDKTVSFEKLPPLHIHPELSTTPTLKGTSFIHLEMQGRGQDDKGKLDLGLVDAKIPMMAKAAQKINDSRFKRPGTYSRQDDSVKPPSPYPIHDFERRKQDIDMVDNQVRKAAKL